MKKIIVKLLLAALVLTLTNTVIAQVPSMPENHELPEFHLTEDTCSINFLDHARYIFIEGSIGKTKGKFMFDTGSQTSLAINRLFVETKGGKKIGTGFNGSGENYDVFRLDTVRDINVGNRLSFDICGPVEANEQKGIHEHLEPQFLGLIGYDFFKGYVMKVDYRNHRLTFYKNTETRNKNQDFLKGEKLITVINLKASLLPNHPLTDLQINGVSVDAGFDTGTPGVLYPTDSFKEELSKKGILGEKDKESETTLKNLEFANGYKGYSEQIHILTPEQGMGIRKAIGFQTENMLELGHGFLAQYKTVWDIQNKKLYLLQR
ncbi:hypothetical protein OQY15_18760 [Pedobacter sp. MC2016-15]|uniref:hypothetical protein n=1 Tax=Pedobacter sp. MC2016-15 TaxID=2994473 RepID=UPI00224609F3|nr:hypothetical protein [Pedobacter sp. MC2016-15]MCX2481153.1 hypothetical protein [Pedobacter sp. MC2016-15]